MMFCVPQKYLQGRDMACCTRDELDSSRYWRVFVFTSVERSPSLGLSPIDAKSSQGGTRAIVHDG
jgi:hypothetical protein